MILQNRPFTPASVTLQKARRLVDPKVGVIRWLAQRTLEPGDPAFFVYVTECCDTSRLGALRCSEHGGSAAVDPRRARAAALGEAIERYCSAIYRESDFVNAAYSDLPPQSATPPEDFALFSERQYAQAGFHFRPFTPDTKLNWSQAVSLTRDQPCLVPACFVYVPYEYSRSEPCITVSHSTGLACANTIEEALLTALCEVVERDAFMLTWLHRLPAPKLSLENVRDETAALVLERLESAGLETHVSVITTDVAIPTFLALLIDRSGAGPAAAVATRADLNPTHGVIRVLEEAALTWLVVKDMMRGEGQGDFESPDEAQPAFLNRSEYLLRYARQGMLPAFNFLLDAPRTVAFDDLPDRSTGGALEDLRTCLSLAEERGFDVLAADVTTADIVEAGFVVARVIVPGLQPLDVDEVRRFRGGRRLYHAPQVLGYSDRAATEDELFEEPHPFP
jgi:ribosomal protein S12 methylthiotransferase accessory factor